MPPFTDENEAPSRNPPAFNVPPVVVWLCGSLLAIHIIQTLLPQAWRQEVLLLFALIPARYDSGVTLPGGLAADIWTPITSMFLHGGWDHLLLNGFWLLAFGSAVARRLGGGRFILFYLLCGVAGSAAYVLVTPDGIIPVIGASGAISGLMGGAARFVFRTGGPLGALPTGFADAETPEGRSNIGAALTDRRVLGFVAVWMGLNWLFGISGIGAGGATIAWEAHAGGFIAGLVMFPLFDPPMHAAPGGPGTAAHGEWRSP